jgi:hypothetical protein
MVKARTANAATIAEKPQIALFRRVQLYLGQERARVLANAGSRHFRLFMDQAARP